MESTPQLVRRLCLGIAGEAGDHSGGGAAAGLLPRLQDSAHSILLALEGVSGT